MACDVNHRLYHTCYVPQHGNFMTNRKPASARIFYDSCHAQGCPVALSSVFNFHSVFKLFILRDCTFKYTIYFFTCVDHPFAFNPVVYHDRTQLTGVPQLLVKNTAVALLQFRCLVIILCFYRPVLVCYLPVGTTASFHILPYPCL